MAFSLLASYTWIDPARIVQRDFDGKLIHAVPGNADWEEFKRWQADGNTPKAAAKTGVSPYESLEQRVAVLETKVIV